MTPPNPALDALKALDDIFTINPVEWRAVNKACADLIEAHYNTIRTALNSAQGWRDISTHDGGSELCLITDGHDISTAYFSGIAWLCKADGQHAREVDGEIIEASTPTHFMPLPQPPAEKE